MARTTGRPGPARRLAAAVAAGTLGWLALAWLVVVPTPAAAAEPCVGVVVDARLLGRGVTTGCAEGDPGSGLAALTKAGFSYAFVPRQPGLVCQVGGLPECGDTSTETYWSYWYRAKGSSRWVYATQGAGTHDPEPGSTEAWVWQDGGRREPPDIALRTICPQVAGSSEPKPTSSSAKPASASPKPASASPKPATSSPKVASGTRRSTTAAPAPTSQAPTSQAPTSQAPEQSAAATTSAPRTTSSSAGSSPADDETATPATSGASPPDPRPAGGGPTPWVGAGVGAGLVALLGGAALARARRGEP